MALLIVFHFVGLVIQDLGPLHCKLERLSFGRIFIDCHHDGAGMETLEPNNRGLDIEAEVAHDLHFLVGCVFRTRSQNQRFKSSSIFLLLIN